MVNTQEYTVGLLKTRALVSDTSLSQGAPLLALHGWLDNVGSFVPLMELSPQWPWVACDLIGHGQASFRSPEGYYYFYDYVCDIIRLIEEHFPNGVHLIGHSLGAAIASIVAGILPDKVHSLILLDAIGPLVSEPAAGPEQARLALYQYKNLRPLKEYPSKEVMALSRQKRHHITKASCEVLVEYGAIPYEKGWAWSFDQRLFCLSPFQMTQEQVLPFLKNISCPVLFVEASQGYPFDKQLLQDRLACINSLERGHIQGGHHAHMDHPDKAIKEISRFFQKHGIQF